MAEDEHKELEPEIVVQLQPGQVVTPGSEPAEQATQQAAGQAAVSQIQPVGLPREESQRVVAPIAHENTPPPAAPAPAAPQPPVTPEAPPAPPPPPAEPVQQVPPSAPAQAGFFHAETGGGVPPAEPKTTREDNSQSPTANGEGIAWEAAEFVAHDKSAGWYATLALATIVLTGLVFLLTKDKITAGVVIVAAIFLGILGARKPKQLHYLLNDEGITIGGKFYSLTLFKSFSVIQEGPGHSIVFIPFKRFAPSTTIYYVPEVEEAIVALLGNHMPYEERQPDIIDQLMFRIRF